MSKLDTESVRMNLELVADRILEQHDPMIKVTAFAMAIDDAEGCEKMLRSVIEAVAMQASTMGADIVTSALKKAYVEEAE